MNNITEKKIEIYASIVAMVKQITGIANNAAWSACLDAHDQLRELPNWRANIKGGGTVCGYFKRAIFAYHSYERNLIYDETFGFFDVRGFSEEQKRKYNTLSNRDYYDFWVSLGCTTYNRMKPMFTSLCNKYRLAFEHVGVKNAETKSWGLASAAMLEAAVTIYDKSIETISNGYKLPLKGLRESFHAFSLQDVSKRWLLACQLAFPECFTDIEPTDAKNIDMGINQIYDSWINGGAMYDDMENTLKECGEDVYKTKGFVKQALENVQKLKNASGW